MENQLIISKYYCGADLHSKTTYFCIMDRDGNILLNRNLPNSFPVFKSLIQPFLPDLVVGAESTYRCGSAVCGAVAEQIGCNPLLGSAAVQLRAPHTPGSARQCTR